MARPTEAVARIFFRSFSSPSPVSVAAGAEIVVPEFVAARFSASSILMGNAGTGNGSSALLLRGYVELSDRGSLETPV